MRIKLVPIGNSKGFRIPKAILEQSGLKNDIELDLRDGELVIRPARVARQGWDRAFEKMRRRGDDQLLDPELAGPSEWDRKEWTW